MRVPPLRIGGDVDLEMLRYLAHHIQDAGGFLFGQQVDLKIEVIAPLGALVHGILPDQHERRQQHGLEREQRR